MRRIASIAVGTLALLGAVTAPANAVPDPVATVNCAVQEVTGVLDPADIALPTEVPGTACIAP
ncbi:hypothetical protein [Streptomyces sp. NPDC046261]|uniref:hypothetical protein n=1 Tax=Streptomyces sp. NPDC046261 TaxID=3157200 RepID=UPI0033D41D7E